jgi:hypothetical protein
LVLALCSMLMHCFISEQMGQPLISDADSIGWLCYVIVAWGKKWLTGSGQGQLPDPVVLEAELFRAEARLMLDNEKQDGSLCIEVRLKTRGPGRHRERYLQVGFLHSARRLDDPRLWRDAAAPRKRRKHRKLLLGIHLSRDVYWAPEVPEQDLKAQIVLSLLALGCLRWESFVRDWMAEYIATSFRIRVSNHLSRPDRQQARAAIVQFAVSRLQHWCFPEHYRAFRMYIGRIILASKRDYFGPQERQTQGYEPLEAGDDEERTRVAEPSWDPKEGAVPWQSALSATPCAEMKAEMSVPAAAAFLERSESYVYRLIRQQRLSRVQGSELIRLHRAEAERAREVLMRRAELRIAREELQESGRTADAARKSVYRVKGAAQRI